MKEDAVDGHIAHKEFEPTIPASERPQIHALERAANVIIAAIIMCGRVELK
jgi:hypothetical protein